jgi:hypothetical protein
METKIHGLEVYPMTSKMRKIINDATESAAFRGHKLGKWIFHDGNTAETTCMNCGKWIQVESNPAPNGIDIGGPAVALNCMDNSQLKGGGL